jgi:hypothetical protein
LIVYQRRLPRAVASIALSNFQQADATLGFKGARRLIYSQ